MEQVEFDSACAKFREQWPKALSDKRASMIFRKWQTLPKGIFESAIDALIYRGGQAPSGEMLDETIFAILAVYNEKSGTSPEKLFKSCVICSHSGIVQASNADGNSCVVACSCELGQYRERSGQAKSKHLAYSLGYVNFKIPLSHKAKKHLEWKDADSGKYSPKLIGIYNTVQRSMLMDDQRGLNGIRLVCKITTEEAFKIYELMIQNNLDHELIRKNNNNSKILKDMTL